MYQNCIWFSLLNLNATHEPFQSDSQMLYDQVNIFSKERPLLLPLSQLTFMLLSCRTTKTFSSQKMRNGPSSSGSQLDALVSVLALAAKRSYGVLWPQALQPNFSTLHHSSTLASGY